MKLSAFCVALLVLAFASAPARAVVGVGDSVSDLSYTSATGERVSLAALKGKLVVIDFWATWCGPCMHEAPHMVAINQKYGPKGLVFLGISLDQDAATMLPGAKGAGLNWPQVIDGGKYSAMFGVNSIPRTFLVGPDGKVLWTGHPAGGLDAAIADAFANHPPFLVDPKIVADASKVLDDVEAKLAANDAKDAMKAFAKVPPTAKLDEKFAAREESVQKKLNDAADATLAEVDPLISAGNYSEAISKLRAISSAFATSPVGQKAKKELADLQAKPEVKAAMAKADADSKSAEALAAATKLQEEKKDAQAYLAFKTVVTDYPGTAAADTASQQLQAYDKSNPALSSAAGEAAVAGKAKAALSIAASYERLGNFDQAKEKYKSIIETYPNTSFAKTAQEHLTTLAGQ